MIRITLEYFGVQSIWSSTSAGFLTEAFSIGFSTGRCCCCCFEGVVVVAGFGSGAASALFACFLLDLDLDLDLDLEEEVLDSFGVAIGDGGVAAADAVDGATDGDWSLD